MERNKLESLLKAASVGAKNLDPHILNGKDSDNVVRVTVSAKTDDDGDKVFEGDFVIGVVFKDCGEHTQVKKFIVGSTNLNMIHHSVTTLNDLQEEMVGHAAQALAEALGLDEKED